MNAAAKYVREEISAAFRRAGRAANLGGVDREELLALFENSEVGHGLLKRARAEREKRRRAIVARREAERAAGERELAAMIREREEKRAARESAQAAFRAAEDAERAADRTVQARESVMMAAIGRADLELEATADPAIDAYVARLDAEYERMRATPPVRFIGLTRNEPAIPAEVAEAQALDAYARGLLAARKEAVALKATDLSGDALADALAEIDSRIPRPDGATA